MPQRVVKVVYRLLEKRMSHTFCSFLLIIHHHNDVIINAMASQITSPTSVYSIVYSGADQRKHQSSASLAFVWGIQRWLVNSPHKRPVTRKMFPFDDVIVHAVSVYHNVMFNDEYFVFFIKFAILVQFCWNHEHWEISTKCNAYFHHAVLTGMPTNDADFLHKVHCVYCLTHGSFNIEYYLPSSL